MKKFPCVAALMLAALILFGCAHHGHCAEAKLKVLASTFPVYLFAANVCAGAPGVEVSLLVPASAGCPHDFALRPQDAQKLAKAQILVINGAGLEEFLEKPLKNIAPNIAVIDASKGLKLLDEDHHPNPHTFAAPAEAALMAKNIGEGLAAADPERGDVYRKNAAAYSGELEKISSALRQVGDKASNRGVAIEHEALAYLAANASLDATIMFEHGNSAAQLGSLKKELLAKKPRALAGDSQYGDRLLQTLAKETGIPFITLDPCASGPDNPPLDYYQKTMGNNLRTLEATFD